MTFLELVRQFDYVRELPGNHGLRVEAIQHWSTGTSGDSWCCEFATMMLDIWFKGNSPIERCAACQHVYELAKEKGWLVATPQVGDIYLFINDAGEAHHIGFVTGVEPLTGISGNTSPDGSSPNGDGVHEHVLTVPLTKIRFVRVPGLNG